jgi:uncharacterized damage-inducible protein DinB
MTVEKLTMELQAAQQEVAASLDGATETELHTAPAEGEWTASEVAAHVVEMQAMWLEKIAHTKQDPDLARSHHEIDRRTAEVDAHSGDDIGTILQRLAESNDRTIGILKGMTTADMDAPCTYGTGRTSGPTKDALRSLVVTHLSGHAEQITTTRQAARSK